MSEKIDISEHTDAICAALGLEPADVGKLELTPSTAVATVYLRNDAGEKYIDEEKDAPAMTRVEVAVAT